MDLILLVRAESKTEPEEPIPGVMNIKEPGEIEGVLSVKKPGLKGAEKITNKSEALKADPSLISYVSDDQNLINVSIEHNTDPEKPISGKLNINEPSEIEGVLSVDKPEEIEGVLSVNKPGEIEGVLSVDKPEEIEGVLSVNKPDKKPDFLLAARGFADAINLLADAARGVINEESSDHLLEMEHKTISIFKRQLPAREAASTESLLAVARKLTDAFNDLREACVIEKRSDQDVIEPRIDNKE